MNLIGSKIIPKIYSSGKRLVLSETVCCIGGDDIELRLPYGDPVPINELILRICFSSDDQKKPAVKTASVAGKNELTVTLVNFDNSLGTATTTPIHFNLGSVQYSIIFYVDYIKNKSVDKSTFRTTITIYGDIP